MTTNKTVVVCVTIETGRPVDHKQSAYWKASGRPINPAYNTPEYYAAQKIIDRGPKKLKSEGEHIFCSNLRDAVTVIRMAKRLGVQYSLSVGYLGYPNFYCDEHTLREIHGEKANRKLAEIEEMA